MFHAHGSSLSELTFSEMKDSTPSQPWKAWYVPDKTATTETKHVVATYDDSQNGQAPNLPVAVVHKK
jgi:hypothetical protein